LLKLAIDKASQKFTQQQAKYHQLLVKRSPWQRKIKDALDAMSSLVSLFAPLAL
jgi:hypothetical protein